VQDQGAELDIRQAFDQADRLDVDVIVVTRGGGTYEDLFTFNEEVVVRAIARARHPVITAIGHQEDHHLADDVADAVYGTPSKAAEAIAQPWVDVRDRIERAKRDLMRAIENVLGKKSQRASSRAQDLELQARSRLGAQDRRFVQLERRLNAQNPLQRLAAVRERLGKQRAKLDGFPMRLERIRTSFDTRSSLIDPAWQRLKQSLTHELRVAATLLDSLDPNAPLARGYAMIFRDGQLVREASDVAAGDPIVARLGRGTLDARVEATRDE
ncbi:MAG: hypothetical protein JOZ01_04755, partial [Candidatus Eremiobacteraeota bacterium]|nr:hypothetical protein [Candidatus Eremiobacteraeota bacterium]